MVRRGLGSRELGKGWGESEVKEWKRVVSTKNKGKLEVYDVNLPGFDNDAVDVVSLPCWI